MYCGKGQRCGLILLIATIVALLKRLNKRREVKRFFYTRYFITHKNPPSMRDAMLSYFFLGVKAIEHIDKVDDRMFVSPDQGNFCF